MNGITDLFHSENEYYDNQRVTGFVQGTVVENNNADFKGMVKVEFTVWESGKNLCEWVRLLVSLRRCRLWSVLCAGDQ